MDKRYVTVEMTKNNKDILKLKARESNLTIQDFVVGAVQNYKPKSNKVCSTCEAKMNKKLIEHEMLFGQHRVIIKNVPTDYCETCNIEQNNLYFDVLLEELANLACNKYLKANRKFPSEFDYQELTKYE